MSITSYPGSLSAHKVSLPWTKLSDTEEVSVAYMNEDKCMMLQVRVVNYLGECRHWGELE